MESLETIKSRLKEIAAQGIDLAFPAAKAALAQSTDAYNNLLLLEGRYQEVMRQLLQGVISNENSAIEVNKIRKDLLNFIDNLQENQLAKSDGIGVDGKPDIYNGEVLYRIPKQMELGVESKCIVRLAFDRNIITEGLEVQDDDVLKDLRISDVMGVELIDPMGNTFEIRTLHDTVQFLEKDLYSEWLFFVKPLTGGTQELVLKISIIEIRNGIERKRNVVLEEKVEIITTSPVDAGMEGDFQKSGVLMTVSNENAIPPPPEMLPPQPSAEVKSFRPTPGSPNQPTTLDPRASRGSKLRKISSVLSAFLVFIVASWAIWNQIDGGGGTVNPIIGPGPIAIDEESSKADLEDFLKNNPDSELKPVVIAKLDSIERKTWDLANESGDLERIKDYTNLYPNGKYVEEANKRIERNKNVLELDAGEIDRITKPGENAGNDNPRSLPDTKIKITENEPLTINMLSRPPLFPGCKRSNQSEERDCTDKQIGKFIKKNLKYPDDARREKIEGVVKVDFIIDKDGSVSGVQYQNDIGGDCAKEAIRLVRQLPKFEPGIDKKGKPAQVKFTLPIRFDLK